MMQIRCAAVSGSAGGARDDFDACLTEEGDDEVTGSRDGRSSHRSASSESVDAAWAVERKATLLLRRDDDDDFGAVSSTTDKPVSDFASRTEH
mmetsp:Transcript_902/g.1455  ORF Transcript_902/g.1455 Transcript_902/m.1455 type:complete len:93 (-) Transcript_902:201-479(-)